MLREVGHADGLPGSGQRRTCCSRACGQAATGSSGRTGKSHLGPGELSLRARESPTSGPGKSHLGCDGSVRGGEGVSHGGIIGGEGTTVERLLPRDDDGVAEALLELTLDIATQELAPQVQEAEERGEFPQAAYRLLGKSGLLSLPFPDEYGGGGQPYEVYLQVIEEIATAWPSVGVGVSVHGLTANVVATNGSDDLKQEWLTGMLSGDWLGASCHSGRQAGSDVSGIRTRAVLDGDAYVVNGTKQWISNGSCADYYILFARTSDDVKRGLSTFVVPAD